MGLLSRAGGQRKFFAQTARYLSCLGLFLVAGAGAVCAQAPLPVPPACLWYPAGGTQMGLAQFATDTNTVKNIVALDHVDLLAMNGSDCGVWAVADKQLFKFDAEAVRSWKVSLASSDRRHRDADTPHQMLVDPVDGGVWLIADQSLIKRDGNGQIVVAEVLPRDVQVFALGFDQSLWALGRQTLLHYSATGHLLSVQDLPAQVDGNPDYLAVDDLRKALWLVNGRQVARLEPDSGNPPLNLRLPDEAVGLALNPFNGTLWIGTRSKLLSYGPDGRAGIAVDLNALGLANPQKLVFDPVAQALWLSAKNHLARLTAEGIYVSARPGIEARGDFAVPAFLMRPTIHLIRPPALTNDPAPTISYAYGALCNARPCELGAATHGKYHLGATLDQAAIGPFVFEAGTGQASYAPMSPLPEGRHTLRAQATDGFGHLSAVVQDGFTIDTIAPRLLNLSPVDGSVANSPNVTIRGMTDDLLANIILTSSSGSASVTTTPDGTGNFAFPVSLKEGLNAFELTAWDRANNSSQAVVRLTYGALDLTIDTPASGATVADGSVWVSGTFHGPLNTGVTVNGVVAAQSGSSFHARVPLKLGGNVLTATATTIAGDVVTKTIDVVGAGPSSIRVMASTTSGLAPLDVSFSVQGATADAIARLEVDFDGDGIIDASTSDAAPSLRFVYNTPGAYPATFRITDGLGATTTKPLMIVAQDKAQIDQALKVQWRGLTDALLAGDKQKAMTYLSHGAQLKFGPVFDVLMPSFPAILPTWSPLLGANIFSEMAEYSLVTGNSSRRQLFLVYFLRGADGVWRLESM